MTAGWAFAQKAPVPRGEAVLADIEPITVARELEPVSVTLLEDGLSLRFRRECFRCLPPDCSGRGRTGDFLYHGETVCDGKLDLKSICGETNPYAHLDIYICKGEGVETYTPTFTYHGFQYALVRGLKPEQAQKSLLTCLVLHTRLRERGGFRCSDETVNALQAMVRRSTLTNFHHFPTDCPQREKNGWTGVLRCPSSIPS